MICGRLRIANRLDRLLGFPIPAVFVLMMLAVVIPSEHVLP
jgi:hypothetical protein